MVGASRSRSLQLIHSDGVLGSHFRPGYGSVGNGPVIVKGTTHALVYNWNGDNAGPSSVAAYQSTFAKLATTFPNARIVPSTFDNFTQHVLPLLDNTDSVPNLEVEMGDTWVYGVPSDPQKLARMRVINRAWRDESARWPGGSVLAAGNSLAVSERPATELILFQGDIISHSTSNNRLCTLCLQADPVLLNATRFALKLGEHTWGRDVKSNLVDNTDWKNPDFYKAKRPPAKTAPQYEILEDSWWEQRHWGITLAVDTLVDGRHRMAAGLVAEMEALKPEVPAPAEGGGFVKAAAGTPYTCGGEQVQFNAAGALTRLGKWVASDNRAVLQLKYRQYSAADVAEFFAQYCKSNAGWVQHDYGKPDLPSDVPGRISAPTLSALWKKSVGAGDCEFVAELAFDPAASTDCGAPETAFVNISISPGAGGADSTADVTMGLFNKTQTRLPEVRTLWPVFHGHLPVRSAPLLLRHPYVERYALLEDRLCHVLIDARCPMLCPNNVFRPCSCNSRRPPRAAAGRPTSLASGCRRLILSMAAPSTCTGSPSKGSGTPTATRRSRSARLTRESPTLATSLRTRPRSTPKLTSRPSARASCSGTTSGERTT